MYEILIHIHLFKETLDEGCCDSVFCTLRNEREMRHFEISWSERHDYPIPCEFRTKEEGNAVFRDLLSCGYKEWSIDDATLSCYPGILADLFEDHAKNIKRIVEEALHEFEII